MRRLWLALTSTGVEPARLAAALRKKEGVTPPTLDDVAQALSRDPETSREHALVLALRTPEAQRPAEVNEQLMDLEHDAQRWSRVPRVCASIATSMGFLLGSLALRQGLLDPTPAVEDLIMRAIDVVAIGVAGATFCVTVHFRASRIVKARLSALDDLVSRLESLQPD